MSNNILGVLFSVIPPTIWYNKYTIEYKGEMPCIKHYIDNIGLKPLTRY